MDGCDLSTAFPSGGVGTADCLNTRSAEESRRQEKKRARKCRGPHLNYLNGGWNMVGPVDPDRQTVKPPAPVPALNPSTGMFEHKPVGQQYPWEGFVGGMDDLPSIEKNVQGPTSLQSGGSSASSSFFGADPSDSAGNGSTRRQGSGNLVETFTSASAPYVNVIGEDESGLLKPDFTKSFAAKGAQKAEGVGLRSGSAAVNQETSYLTPTGMTPNSILPFPNTDMFWKNNPTTGGQSSFFASLRPPGGLPVGVAPPQETGEEPKTRKEMMEKLDRIFARLDDMDHQKSENAQTEVLLFIMTGLGVIFLMDIGCRAAASMARR